MNQLTDDKPEQVIKHLTKSDFLQLVMDYEKNRTEWKFNGERPCIIDFYADWCGPCRMVSPIMEELAVEYTGKVDFYKVNVDKEKELAQVFGISGIPSFLFCPREGKPTMTSGVAGNKDQIKDIFKTYIEDILFKNKGK